MKGASWCKEPTCGASIEWFKTVNDKWIPLDSATDPEEGNWLVDADGIAHFVKREDRGRLKDYEVQSLQTCHWGTCTAAPKFKKEKKDVAKSKDGRKGPAPAGRQQQLGIDLQPRPVSANDGSSGKRDSAEDEW